MRKNITTDTAHFFLTDEFSQWYPSKFTFALGIEFNCAEQWMMYCKADLFNAPEIMEKVLEETNPKEMKKLGRDVKDFNKEQWDSKALDFVILGNVMKFSQNPELWEILNNTGDRMLVEAADYDRIWGIGLKAEDAILVSQDQWQGTNLLGKALMQTRQILRENPQLIVEQSILDKKIFSFVDEPGQKIIRLSVMELAEQLDCSVGDIPNIIPKDSVASLTYPPFVKKIMVAPTNELLEIYNKMDFKGTKKLRI